MIERNQMKEKKRLEKYNKQIKNQVEFARRQLSILIKRQLAFSIDPEKYSAIYTFFEALPEDKSSESWWLSRTNYDISDSIGQYTAQSYYNKHHPPPTFRVIARETYIHQDPENKRELCTMLEAVIRSHFQETIKQRKYITDEKITKFVSQLVTQGKIIVDARVISQPHLGEAGEVISWFTRENEYGSYRYHTPQGATVYYKVKDAFDLKGRNWKSLDDEEMLTMVMRISLPFDIKLQHILPYVIGHKLSADELYDCIGSKVRQNSKHLLYKSAHTSDGVKEQDVYMPLLEKQTVLSLMDRIQFHKNRPFNNDENNIMLGLLEAHTETLYDVNKNKRKNKKIQKKLNIPLLENSIKDTFTLS